MVRRNRIELRPCPPGPRPVLKRLLAGDAEKQAVLTLGRESAHHS